MNQPPHLFLAPLTEENGKEICTWRYAPPYDIYNSNTWEAMFEAAEEFADPVIRKEQYFGVFASPRESVSSAELSSDGAINSSGKHTYPGELYGFAQLFPMAGVTRLGLGLRPHLCGQGIGVAFVKAIIDEAIKKAPANQIDLEVLVWNERAYKVYTKAGFVYEQTYERMTPTGMASFHVMVFNPDLKP